MDGPAGFSISSLNGHEWARSSFKSLAPEGVHFKGRVIVRDGVWRRTSFQAFNGGNMASAAVGTLERAPWGEIKLSVEELE